MARLVSYRSLRKSWVVNGLIWEIKFKRRLEHIKDGTKGEVLGLTDSESQEVTIKLGLSESDLLETVIHEFLHVLAFSYGIEIPHPLIYLLEKPVANLILDNVA